MDTTPDRSAETSPTPTRRKNDPEGMRRRILEAALDEFARAGLSGARLDAIAERAQTSKRMVVYYFKSKVGLYVAVLEKVYGDIREAEQEQHIETLTPVDAVARLVELSFDYQSTHPEFNRLVSIENIHYARHIAKSRRIRNDNRSVIDAIDAVLARGRAAGVFRDDVDAIDLHLLISALCFFPVSNRHTFAVLFGRDPAEDANRERHRRIAVNAVLAYLTAK
ncbi:TetR/AcrR family transcriptional regulator [Crenobacter sp. SG2303]|uniref:TetR/AcrR family transcriptional regulator n=1 Tax=Crenobacter oryzisoli TaxID=3056844 RepID=A0ABT7XMZ8_9NEIS|nr:TetR/AcrR family transcriptional regulator [Crenobacter sp. SG2303]MDN0075157.1 TetR/AcrR family transcriptional regulator [Crenobacter sp. SG2303]